MSSDNFWENLIDTHWDKFVLDCERAGIRPRVKNFMIWAEEMNLVPDYD